MLQAISSQIIKRHLSSVWFSGQTLVGRREVDWRQGRRDRNRPDREWTGAKHAERLKERESRDRAKEKEWIKVRWYKTSEAERKRDIKSLCHVQQGLNTYFIYPTAGHEKLTRSSCFYMISPNDSKVLFAPLQLNTQTRTHTLNRADSV